MLTPIARFVRTVPPLLDLAHREEGQTATEYAIVLGVIVLGLGAPTLVLRDTIVGYITRVGAALAGLPF